MEKPPVSRDDHDVRQVLENRYLEAREKERNVQLFGCLVQFFRDTKARYGMARHSVANPIHEHGNRQQTNNLAESEESEGANSELSNGGLLWCLGGGIL